MNQRQFCLSFWDSYIYSEGYVVQIFLYTIIQKSIRISLHDIIDSMFVKILKNSYEMIVHFARNGNINYA